MKFNLNFSSPLTCNMSPLVTLMSLRSCLELMTGRFIMLNWSTSQPMKPLNTKINLKKWWKQATIGPLMIWRSLRLRGSRLCLPLQTTPQLFISFKDRWSLVILRAFFRSISKIQPISWTMQSVLTTQMGNLWSGWTTAPLLVIQWKIWICPSTSWGCS